MRWIRSLGHAAAFQQGTSPKNYPSKFRPSSPAQTPFPSASHDSAARHYTALPAACPLLPAPSTKSIALSKSALQHHHSSNKRPTTYQKNPSPPNSATDTSQGSYSHPYTRVSSRCSQTSSTPAPRPPAAGPAEGRIASPAAGRGPARRRGRAARRSLRSR